MAEVLLATKLAHLLLEHSKGKLKLNGLAQSMKNTTRTKIQMWFVLMFPWHFDMKPCEDSFFQALEKLSNGGAAWQGY